MDKVEYLPLGSVVVLKGGIKKIIIIARGLGVKIGDETVFFDYGGCMYPEGMIGDSIMYFQHEDIMKTVFEGYSDEDNELMVANINTALEATLLKRGNVQELKKERAGANG